MDQFLFGLHIDLGSKAVQGKLKTPAQPEIRPLACMGLE
jgi:hypothetical protein